MWLLIAVSFVWALSFGLIKGRLTGLDANAVATVRLALSLLVFLPFLRWRAVRPATAAWLAAIGAIQFGAMYALYLHAFRYLEAHEVALFTIFTPLYVTLFDATIARRLSALHFGAAALSVIGAGLLLWQRLDNAGFMRGFMLMQGSNLCFAAGQVAYKLTRPAIGGKTGDAGLFGWLYLGATAVALAACVKVGPGGVDMLAAWRDFHPTPRQWLVLAYLGTLASGACFFLWNLGATKVNAGTLAVVNNLKIPLGVVCSLLVFGESASPAKLAKLTVCLVLVAAALWLTERKKNPAGR